MANQVEKLNTIAIANIEAINGLNDTAIEAINGLEFTGVIPYTGITWSTDDVLPADVGAGVKMGVIGATAILNGETKATYEHDGSSWSTTGSCSVEHQVAGGGGTQSAGVAFGGYDGSTGDDSIKTEEYNGSTWSTGNDMFQESAFASGGGTLQTAQLCTGGSNYNPTVRDIKTTQTYNGTNWANESVNSSGQGSGGSGESGGGGLDAFFLAGGALDAPGVTGACQIFDQSAGTWTSKATMSLPVRYLTGSTDGTRVYKIGGYSPNSSPGFTETAVVESWVENTWTTENSLPAARRQGGNGTGGAEATGGASNIGGAGSGGASRNYYIAAAS